MKTIIRKRPRAENLLNKSLSLNQTEFDLVNDPKVDSEIQVFDEATNELLHTIPKAKYPKLTATPRKLYADYGDSSIYVVDFAAAISKRARK